MSTAITITFTGPATVGDIREKVAAFRSLTGQYPQIWVKGFLYSEDGDDIFAQSSPVEVVHVGYSRLSIKIEGSECFAYPTDIKAFTLSSL